jgi:plastocyanin
VTLRRIPGRAVAVAVGGLVLALPAAAAAPAGAPVAVSVQFQAYAPEDVEALPGDTVEWTNSSPRSHTVTAADGSFDSGELEPGATFSRTFAAEGTYAYHCTIHLSMAGTVAVRPLILDAIPPAPVAAGTHVELSGRTSASGPVAVERDTGAGFRPVASAAPAADGSWSADVPAVTTADYRAVEAGTATPPRRLLVIDRTVNVRATRSGIDVTVTPATPHAPVLLQLRLRSRFGWWPVRRARLDYLSRAHFAISRRALARVLLVDRDGWTAIATSPAVRAGR